MKASGIQLSPTLNSRPPAVLQALAREVEDAFQRPAATQRQRLASASYDSVAEVKPIEAVEIGDQVWAWDDAKGARVKRYVKRLFRRKSRPVLQVLCINEEADVQAITATTEHPFWIEGKGWVPAQDLEPGNVLKCISGEPGMCVLRVVDNGDRTDVHNFEVGGAHNYFVGETGVLVHNESYLEGGEKPRNAAVPSITVNAERGVVVANFVHPENGGIPAGIDADYVLNRYSHLDDTTAGDLPKRTLYVLAHGNEAGPVGMGVLDGTLAPGLTNADLLAGIGQAMDVARAHGIGVDQVLTGICGGGRGTEVNGGVSLGQLVNDFVQPPNGTAAFDGLAHIDGRGIKGFENRKLGAPYSVDRATQLTPSRMTYIPGGEGTGYVAPFLDMGAAFDREAPTLPPQALEGALGIDRAGALGGTGPGGRGSPYILHQLGLDPTRSRILAVGAGDFSFELDVATAPGVDPRRLTVTDYAVNRDSDVRYAASINKRQLERLGASVQLGVDATNLAGTLGAPGPFDTISFTGPHSGARDIRANQALLRGFFGSARGVLAPGGEIVVSLNNGPIYDAWQIGRRAAEAGLVMTNAAPFDFGRFTGYGQVKVAGSAINLMPGMTSYTFIDPTRP